MLVIRIFFIGPIGIGPMTKWLQVQFQYGTCNKGKMKGGKVGPASARGRFLNARRATPRLRTEGIIRTCPTVADNGFIPTRLQFDIKHLTEELNGEHPRVHCSVG